MVEHHESWTRAQAIDFLDASREWAPRSLLLEALDRPDAPGAVAPEPGTERHAADLGCGAGTESLELLRRGYRVLAIDLHPECVEETRRRALGAGLADRLDARVGDLASLDLPRSRFDLVHAGFALPFCPRAAWPRCWATIARSVVVGGRFVGQFFGPGEPMVRDAPSGSATSLDRDAVAALREAVPGVRWSIDREDEIDRPGRGPRGEAKHWHLFHVRWRREA